MKQFTRFAFFQSSTAKRDFKLDFCWAPPALSKKNTRAITRFRKISSPRPFDLHFGLRWLRFALTSCAGCCDPCHAGRWPYAALTLTPTFFGSENLSRYWECWRDLFLLWLSPRVPPWFFFSALLWSEHAESEADSCFLDALNGRWALTLLASYGEASFFQSHPALKTKTELLTFSSILTGKAIFYVKAPSACFRSPFVMCLDFL